MTTAFRRVHGSYSRWLNIRLRRTGHAWHAGLIAAPQWLETRGSEERYPPMQGKVVRGLGFRQSGDLDRLREATRTGRPFGTDDFVAELEAKRDRNLFPQKPGPKPKELSQTVRSSASIEFGS